VTAANDFLFNPQLFIFFVVFAVIAFLRAQRFRQATGRNPWGIHPVVWLVLGLLFGIIGSICCLIAVMTSKHRGPVRPATGGAPSPYGAGPPAPGATLLPPPPAPTGFGPPPTTAPAGWAPDPSGRYEHRYWSGSEWTEHVSTAGTTGQDPVPPTAPQPPTGPPPSL
jgi:hypothetical protein